jgi:hypothetical protein
MDRDFNEKWKEHLEKGHYGMDLSGEEVEKYVDEEFEKVKEEYPNFTYTQIKEKFGGARVYMHGVPYEITSQIEKGIQAIWQRQRNDKAHQSQA